MTFSHKGSRFTSFKRRFQQVKGFSVPLPGGVPLTGPSGLLTQASKRHININFFVRLVLGRPRDCPGDFTGFVPGTNPVKPGTNPGFLLILHSGSPISPGLSPGQTRFVPGTIPGTKGGTESLCEKSLCAFFARYLRADPSPLRASFNGCQSRAWALDCQGSRVFLRIL